MVRIYFHRSKCIGCNACTEANSVRWRISRKDGKSNLIGSKEKSGIYRMELGDDEYKLNLRVASICPVKIIKVERTPG